MVAEAPPVWKGVVFGGFVRKESCVEYVDRVYGRGKECVGKERQCPP